MSRVLRQISFMLGLLGAVTAPLAADWYAGAGAGVARHDVAAPPDRAFTTTTFQDDPRDATVKAYVGRYLGSLLSLQLGYQDYGSMTREVRTCTGCLRPGGAVGTVRSSRSTRALHLDLVGDIPVAGAFGIVAGIGATRMRIQDREESRVLTAGVDLEPRITTSRIGDNATALHLLMGLSWKIDGAWKICATFEYVGRSGENSAGGEPGSGEAKTTSTLISFSRAF